jgi:hypothetical protein
VLPTGCPGDERMPTVEETQQQCRLALSEPAFAAIATALHRRGTGLDQCVTHVSGVTERLETVLPLSAIKADLERDGLDLADARFERCVLTAAALRSMERLDQVPVSESVKALCCDLYVKLPQRRPRLDLMHHSFVELSKVATFRRFPAGQFDWETSGLPRSWLPKIRPIGALCRTLHLIATRMRRFGPAFVIHTGVGGKNYALLEREAERSYFRMAQSMALQPRMIGLITSSWLFSPDTFAISPHLAWLNKVFRENGAVLANMGPADPGCGVLHRSPERKRAYDEGRLKPTLGLVIWPRDEMLAWARTRPDLEP